MTYFKQGQLKEAEDLQLQVVKDLNRKLGKEHPWTLSCLGTLALIYRDQGRLEEVEQMSLEILEICERVLGPDHPDTLFIMNGLPYGIPSAAGA
jgi:hypothetical protein